MAQDTPTHVAGFTIQASIEFGAFGRSYVGFHSAEGRRILKILRAGEDLAVSDEEHAKLKEDASLLHFEPRHQTDQGERVLVAHFYQAASFGLLVGGSELQKGCEKTLRELDPNAEAMQMLRGTTLQQRLELLKQVAQRLEQLHAEKKAFPFITPWNIMLSDARPKLVDVGLGYSPEKLDAQQVHEDVLAYYAPEVLRAIAQKQAIQVGPAADVYGLGLSMRSILLERVAEVEGTQPGAAPAAAPGAAPGAAPIGLGKREALLAGKAWKKVPQEKISRRLEALLARAAAHEPGRRPTAAQLVKEIDAILKDKDLAWSPPSQAPKLILAAVAVLAIVGAVAFALMPDAAETTIRKAYADATAKKGKEALALFETDAFKKIPTELLKNHQEIARARAIAALEEVQTQPAAAVEELRRYADAGGVSPADALTARFVAAFVQRWATLEHDKSKGELETVANSSAEGAKEIPELAKCALHVWPFGVEGEVKPEDVKKWTDLATAARGVDAALEKTWAPTDAGYEKLATKPAAKGFAAKWIATALLGRLKDLAPTDNGQAELQAARDAFPSFAMQGALALHAARFAKDEKDIEGARKELEAAAKLMREGGSFAEGSVALADLTAKQAATAKDPVAGYKAAQKAYTQASNEKPATPGADLKAACTRGALLAGARAGIAVGLLVASGNAPEAAVLRDAETGLAEFLAVAEKDAKNPELGALLSDAHVALGLVIQAQPNRAAAEWAEHLLHAYKDADLVGQHAYRLAESPANGLSSKLLFEQAKKDFTANATSDKPDTEKDKLLHAQIDALCKLEKFDTSFMTLTDAQFHRNEANNLKDKKKRTAALRAAASAFQGVFGMDAQWQAGLEGMVEALATIADEMDDTKDAGKALTDAQQFLDKAADNLKQRKITGKDVTKALDAQKALVRKKWFVVLAKWLNSKGDAADFSQQDDQDFATTLFNVAEGSGAPELDGPAKAQVAQLHWLYGKWCYDQKNYTVAAANLATAVEGLPPEKDALQSQAALLAADVALTKADNVRADESPWHGGVKEAANWGRDVLAKRLGFTGFKTLFDAARQNKLTLIKDEAAAKRLVDDILKNEDSVSPEDLGAAAMIYGKSAKAQLLLARAKNKANVKDEARSSAKKALELADAQQPDVIVEAASIWCVNTTPEDMTTADFKLIVDRAIATKDAAVAKLKGDPRFKFAFVGLYWMGRFNQATADDKSNAKQDADAKKYYAEAQKSYLEYVRAVKEASADRPPECQDADSRATKCGIAANQ